MSEFKYTSDGKKVVVIGPLNAEQTIVQEIFVSGEKELPSGKNFVVDSLHDEPVESHLDRRVRRAEKRVKELDALVDRKIEQRKRSEMELKAASQSAAMRVRSLVGLEQSEDLEEQLEMLAMFVGGEISHVFINQYEPEIIEFKDAITAIDKDRWNWEGDVKLLSLFGKTNGDLSWKVNQYRDGSGYWTEVIPARSYEEAVEYAQASLDEKAEKYLAAERGHLNFEKWQSIEGIVIPPDALKKAQNQRDTEARKQISIKEKELAALRAKLNPAQEG